MSTNTAAPMPRHPLIELWTRYRAVFKAAWEHRAELAGPQRLADETAFLPAALSLQETPVHPAPRRLAWTIMVLFLLALVWSIFGQVDIVAVAPGRIIVSDRTKVIQPLEASVVKSVLVKDGDRVRAGQVLVELDPTMASADKASVQEQLNAAISEEQRTAALLKALATGQAPSLPKGADAGTRSLLQSEWQDIRAKLAKLDAETARRRAEMATVQATIAKLEDTVPMAQAREADFKRLVDQGYISGHATQDKTRERVELERDLSTQRARLAEAQAMLRESEGARASFRAETVRQLNDRNAQAATKRLQFGADHSKASQRERLTQLTAPVDGIVQQLAIHTTGGVVTSAQPLMIVVPDSPTVTAEITVANQDIGFVNAGQTATVKLETFPYLQQRAGFESSIDRSNSAQTRSPSG
ncbi:MAG: HlyD family type I secretion periplasmic adaptor subunit [Hylemonella sp.]|nr:HlyD family type I secretion periplasmic adaptor subunit [Hylemonella sp.]